jgi:hypothetical protein
MKNPIHINPLIGMGPKIVSLRLQEIMAWLTR